MFSKLTIFVDKSIKPFKDGNRFSPVNIGYTRATQIVGEIARFAACSGEGYVPPDWLSLEDYGRFHKMMNPRGCWGECLIHEFAKAHRAECVLRRETNLPKATFGVRLSLFAKGKREPMAGHCVLTEETSTTCYGVHSFGTF